MNMKIAGLAASVVMAFAIGLVVLNSGGGG